MDSRSKIVSADEAARLHRGKTVFVASFDILTPALIRAISSAGPKVLTVVVDPPRPLRTALARAQLAASLNRVCAVVHLTSAVEEFLSRIQPDKIVHWEREDAQTNARLIGHVQSLHAI